MILSLARVGSVTIMECKALTTAKPRCGSCWADYHEMTGKRPLKYTTSVVCGVMMNWLRTWYDKLLTPWALKLLMRSNSVTQATAFWPKHPWFVCDMMLKYHQSTRHCLSRFENSFWLLGPVACWTNHRTK